MIRSTLDQHVIENKTEPTYGISQKYSLQIRIMSMKQQLNPLFLLHQWIRGQKKALKLLRTNIYQNLLKIMGIVF